MVGDDLELLSPSQYTVWAYVMRARRYTCVVCGRVFPDGQGIVIRTGDVDIAFHSSRCAAKFLRMLIDKGSKEVVSASLRLARELETLLTEKREKSSKKI